MERRHRAAVATQSRLKFVPNLVCAGTARASRRRSHLDQKLRWLDAEEQTRLAAERALLVRLRADLGRIRSIYEEGRAALPRQCGHALLAERLAFAAARERAETLGLEAALAAAESRLTRIAAYFERQRDSLRKYYGGLK